jgi:hypothetical protein
LAAGVRYNQPVTYVIDTMRAGARRPGRGEPVEEHRPAGRDLHVFLPLAVCAYWRAS